ncbi:MAG: helix-turn-helix transcriptional regulator [Ruminococcaceae bacterium]|nr:helix-turn-helix transcriptional regulator [Oscillospiraceae bacterium]
MILADKIIRLRKKNGWSQEELAEKMNVSRQAVSKWEGAQTIPDLDKILQLGELFGVTTDYLLKDEIEDEEFTNDASDSIVRKISIEEANQYLNQRKRASWQIAIATFLCIISPITLIVLGAASEIPEFGVSETLMGVVGLIVLFAFVLCAVPIYIYCGFKNEPFAFLDTDEPFELAYGVRGLVTERQKQFRDTYVRCNIIATCLCIFSPIPLIVSGFSGDEMLCVLMLAIMMIIAGIGVAAFIVVGVRNASMQKLLKEGEYTEKEKKKSGLKEAVGFAYWGILVAIFLVWNYSLGDWGISWIVFAIGGVLFPIVMKICDYISDKK